MKKRLLTILLGLGLLTSLSYAGYNMHGNTEKIIARYRANYLYKDYVKNATGTKEFNLTNLNRVELEIDVDGESGELTVVLLDNEGKEVLKLENPHEFEKKLILNSAKDYKLKVILNNFSGKYEIELESK